MYVCTYNSTVLFPNATLFLSIPYQTTLLSKNIRLFLQMSGSRTFRPVRDVSAHAIHIQGRDDLMMLQERLNLGLSLVGNSTERSSNNNNALPVNTLPNNKHI